MDSTHVAISILQSETQAEPTPPSTKEEKKQKIKAHEDSFVEKIVSHLREKTSNTQDMRKLIHSAKVGAALVLISFLYLLDPLYNQVGDNAMWAVMTVVVMFDFYAGATLGKGLNRGIGTILGGGLGCLVAYLAQQVGGIGNSVIITSSVFIFGAGATYTRTVPRIKKRYDYGAMIFILTFNLVVVSGMRAEKVLEIARERLSTVGMGLAVCVFVSLMVFPIWASDELHDSTSSNFINLANSLQGCMEDYFRLVSEKETEPSATSFTSCKSVLNSKAKDELLANFAKWEPWHGKYGLYHPWEQYLKIGELLRELAASLISLKHSHVSHEAINQRAMRISGVFSSVEPQRAWGQHKEDEEMQAGRANSPETEGDESRAELRRVSEFGARPVGER
ncbi:hypothetical protein TIFTF001_017945 [Ficus carica]|uniref:Aluminum-activated malate transporter n=1 Tax=Ficus carica TaxID=3494 RepID=A0AA88AM60_FICCA|nr:hypothetical protein TIFTF001_017945 [Ficus carica]